MFRKTGKKKKTYCTNGSVDIKGEVFTLYMFQNLKKKKKKLKS